MDVWTEKEYIDWRFGFPVHLLDVPMKKVRGEDVPLINGKILRLTVLTALVVKPGPLTGHEVRFIRLWLEKTLTAFGQELDVTHAAVKKWESQKDQPTGTNRTNDFYIRYLVMEKLLQEDFALIFEAEGPVPSLFQKLYQVLREKESFRFLRRLRETLSVEINEPQEQNEPLTFHVQEIPKLNTIMTSSP